MRCFSVVLLTFFIISTQSNTLHDVANDSANIVTKILGSFQGTGSMNLTRFFSTFDMPSCLRRCMPAVDNVGMLLDAAKNPDAMKAMCQNLTESTKCATATGCDATLVGALSNAFQFVCMDNLDKVSGQIACIQEHSGDIQQDCEAECAVQADVIEKAAKNSADQLFNMENLCNSTTCMANCYQDKLPKYCDIGEDNVIDTIFSNFESLEQPGLFSYLKKEKSNQTGIAKLFGMMMPEGCSSEKMKIKIPKKLVVPDKPKSVGSPAALQKKLPIQKESLTKSANNSSEESYTNLMAKSGNMSSAALLYNGKVHTLQCQFLDSRGNPQKTPDFETLSSILSEHFNNRSTPTTTKAPAIDSNTERKCRDVSSEEPQMRNTAAITIVFSIFSIVATFSL